MAQIVTIKVLMDEGFDWEEHLSDPLNELFRDCGVARDWSFGRVEKYNIPEIYDEGEFDPTWKP